MRFVQGTSRNALGATVIRAPLGAALPRAGFERVLLPSVQVGLPGWERSHSQGPGTGHESPHGMVYAPPQVNQGLQRLGIERYLRELVRQNPGVELWLTTETYTHTGSDRLKEIIYRVDAFIGPQHRMLFEAGIRVANRTVNPTVDVDVLPLAIQKLY
jgi:hypothetical protein